MWVKDLGASSFRLCCFFFLPFSQYTYHLLQMWSVEFLLTNVATSVLEMQPIQACRHGRGALANVWCCNICGNAGGDEEVAGMKIVNTCTRHLSNSSPPPPPPPFLCGQILGISEIPVLFNVSKVLFSFQK